MARIDQGNALSTAMLQPGAKFQSDGFGLVTGTVVTATGPHAGDENAVRLGFALTSVARVHSVSVLVTIALIIYLAVRAKQVNGDANTRDAIQALLFAAVFQGAIGYAQYLTGVPVALVAVHIVGATALWFAVCNLAVSPSRGVL